jgi:drug/metabolite transporter (DMT)-like permease
MAVPRRPVDELAGRGGQSMNWRVVAGRPASLLQARLDRAGPVLRGMLWMIAGGVCFALLNTMMRLLSQQLDPFVTQFLRYVFGVLVLLPLVLRSGLRSFVPRSIRGQFWRGAVHTSGLLLWFYALPHVQLADTVALGFTAPIFMMFGAWIVFREVMKWDRWVAAVIGFVGVLIVVGPRLDGEVGFYYLVMLMSAPVFAASYLIVKAMTRTERSEVIVVWQSVTVSLFSLPFALYGWTWPEPWQWGLFILTGVFGSAAHYCMTRAFRATDVSATQPARFLELIWASLLGWLVFADQPSQWTLLGGMLILAVTVWIARREARH